MAGVDGATDASLEITHNLLPAGPPLRQEECDVDGRRRHQKETQDCQVSPPSMGQRALPETLAGDQSTKHPHSFGAGYAKPRTQLLVEHQYQKYKSGCVPESGPSRWA